MFWDSLSSLEYEIETLTEVNKDKSETIVDAKVDNTESKFEAELFKKVWGNIHMNKALENELNLRNSTLDTLSRNNKNEITFLRGDNGMQIIACKQ